MPNNTARVILVSNSAFLWKTIQHLVASPYVSSITQASSITIAEQKLLSVGHNVLLLDIDESVIPPEWFITKLADMQTSIIYTGSKPDKIKAIQQEPGKTLVEAPQSASNNSISYYINTISMEVQHIILSQWKLARQSSRTVDPAQQVAVASSADKVICMASSAGGTDVLETIFKQLPENMPPILVVQHIANGFSKMLAEWLNKLSKLEIREACSGDILVRNTVLIAPTGLHMTLYNANGQLRVKCAYGTKMHGVIPAADVLFQSASEVLKEYAIGVILTGMGSDGARGLLSMHNQGALTIGQDKESSLIYGMPKVAYDLGAVDYQLPADQIAAKLVQVSR